MRKQLHDKLTAVLTGLDEVVDQVLAHPDHDMFACTLDYIQEQREWIRVGLGMVIDAIFVDKVGGTQGEDSTPKII